MSTYSVQGNYNAGGLMAQGITPITLGDVTGNSKKFPNHKVTINIYGAQGGYIVEIGRGGYGNEPDLHIIPESEDFDRSLGKIITEHQLKQT